jgi:hypothetical protein
MIQLYVRGYIPPYYVTSKLVTCLSLPNGLYSKTNGIEIKASPHQQSGLIFRTEIFLGKNKALMGIPFLPK